MNADFKKKHNPDAWRQAGKQPSSPCRSVKLVQLVGVVVCEFRFEKTHLRLIEKTVHIAPPEHSGLKIVLCCWISAAFFLLGTSKAGAETPGILAGAVSGKITSCVGTASVSPYIQQFDVSGNALTGDVTANAPPGFELSLLKASGYSNSVILVESGGVLASTTVYVRSAATAPAGNISGNVTMTSPGTSSVTVVVSGTVNALATVNAVANQAVFTGFATTAIHFGGTGNGYTWVNNTPAIGLAASGAGDIASFQAVNTGSTPITATITVTPVSNTYAYITDAANNTVSVINTTTNTFVGNIAMPAGPVGVAVSPDGTRVYISDENAGSVSVISTASNTIISSFGVGQSPLGIAVSPDGTQLYVACQGSNTVAIINTATYSSIATINVGKNPYAIAVSHDGTTVAVSNFGGGTVSIINAAINKLATTIPVGNGPEGVAFSPDGSSLYVANSLSASVSVINTATDGVVGTPGVGTKPACLVVSPDASMVYITNAANNTISVISTMTNSVVNTIPTGNNPEGISLNTDGAVLYETNLVSNDVWAFNTSNWQVIAKIPVGKSPWAFGNFLQPGTGCPGVPTTFTITVNPAVPTITAGLGYGNIIACAGSGSAYPDVERFTVSGNFLSTGITATSPVGFEISLAPTTGYGTTLQLTESNGLVPATVIYVQAAASATTGPISGNVVLQSAGAPTQLVAVAGSVNPLPTVDPVKSQTLVNTNSTKAVTFSGTAETFAWTNDTPGIGLAASGVGNIPSFTAVNGSSSPVTATVTVVPQQLPAFAYIPDVNLNSILVFNTANQQQVASITVGQGAAGVSVSPDGNRVYVGNAQDNTISVINAVTNKVVAIVPVAGSPYGLSVSPDGKMVYVASSDTYDVYAISTAINQVVATIPVPAYSSYAYVSPDGSRLYVSAANQVQSVYVFNTSNYALIATVNLPDGGVPVQMTASADGTLLYVASDAGDNFFIINTTTFSVQTVVPVGYNGHGLALTPDGNKIYVANTGSNTVSVISPATGAVITTIPVGVFPTGISITPNGQFVYVVCQNQQANGTLTIISTTLDQVESILPLGNNTVALGNFITPVNGCTGNPITFQITVDPTPVPGITPGAVTGTITACQGTAAVSPDIAQFTVTGIYLTAPVIVTAPINFELSLSAAGVYSSSLALDPSSGAVGPLTVFVRSAASAPAGSLSGQVTLTSTGVAQQTVNVNAVVDAIPTVNSIADQTFVGGSSSTAVTFSGTASSFTWTNDTPAIGLPASGTGDISPFTTINSGNTPITATITVTPLNGNNCTGAVQSFTITVNPQPVLTITGTLSPLTTVYGTPSASESFSISGAYLTSGLLVTPPAGFELSANGSTFSNTATIANTGTALSAPVFIRLAAATPVGVYSGNITLSSTNAVDVSLLMPNSTVTPAALTVTANSLTRTLGMPNPALTLSYTGFVNGDTPEQLTTQPTATTQATIQSPVGQYPIDVSGGVSANYIFNYVNGVLTIAPPFSTTEIPNTFTPNGDGINDTWDLKLLYYYPRVTVNIFDRWGQKVYSSVGYSVPWDGTSRGKALPTGTYYYLIDPQNGQQPIAGWVAIIR